MIGPSRKPSKVEIASEKKKKSGKRKQPEVGDSDYEVEEDVPHIVSNSVSSAKKKSQKKFRRAAIPDLDVSTQKWKFVANRRLALERELSAEALEQKEIIALIEKAGLMKTVSGLDIEIAGPSIAAPTGSGSMSRKEMIASLEAACKALDEKKKSLEQVIIALRQEEAAEEGEHVQVGQEGGDQSEDGGTEELELSDASADF
ncbi:hypothetical protein QL285_008288 [Trifolium repens]|nr:hypothetical protein QL285_008288 [Trifolium repens]